MWFGTADGLNRYDGYTFTQFRSKPGDTTTISNNTIRSLYEDRNDVLWIGTDRGLNRFDQRTQKFSRFILYHSTGQSSLPLGIAQMLEDHAGRFWVGTALGLFLFDRDLGRFDTLPNWQYVYVPSNNIIALHEDASLRFWIGTWQGVRGLEDKAGAFIVSPLPQPLRILENLSVSRIFTDRNGRIWFCTWKQGVVRFDPTAGIARSFAAAGGTPYHTKAIAEDEFGRIWVGAESGWLTVLGSARDSFSLNAGLSSKSFAISTVYRDQSGVMWIGTDGNGIFKSDRQRKQFRHYKHDPANRNSLAADFVKAVLEDDEGNLWVGTHGGGLSRLNRKSGVWRHFSHQPGNKGSLPHDRVHALAQDEDGALWAGTESGLARFNRRSQMFVTFRIPSADQSANIITSITNFTRDTLAVGTRLQPWLFTSSSGSFFPLVDKFGDTVRGSTWTLNRDRSGALWWGTYGSGAGCIRDRRGLYRWFEPGHNSLSNGAVRAIYEDATGVFWFGTEDGLNRYDPSSESWTTYNVEHGLPNAFIYGILPDDNGNLWISTNKGLSRFNLATRVFRNYGPDDGLQSNEFNTGAYFRSPRGELFFGGINGLNAFFPDSIKDNLHAPAVVLTGFKKFDLPADSDTAPTEIQDIELRYDENIFSFEFAALEYTDPEKNTYAYKMDGFEKEWTYSGTRREVRYTSLPAGRYVFRVKAANNDGAWSEQGLSVPITIIPPFWQTWWFIGFATLLGLGSVGGAIRFIEMRKLKKKIEQLEQEQALEHERMRISKDMHDDVGANLTKIAIMSELALKSAHQPDAVEQLEKISNTARDVVDNISQIVWALNPKNNKLDNLMGYIREHALEFFEGTPVQCRCEFPDQFSDVPMSAEVRRNVFLAVKEALNNVAKHSRATEVRLSMTQTSGGFSLLIQDNGRGFDMSRTPQHSNGLVNMKKRMEEIGGRLEIHAAQQEGTRVEMAVVLTEGR